MSGAHVGSVLLAGTHTCLIKERTTSSMVARYEVVLKRLYGSSDGSYEPAAWAVGQREVSDSRCSVEMRKVRSRILLWNWGVLPSPQCADAMAGHCRMTRPS